MGGVYTVEHSVTDLDYSEEDMGLVQPSEIGDGFVDVAGEELHFLGQ